MINNTELAQLIFDLKNEDKRALGILWSAMKEGLYSFILSFIQDRQLAEDALQETFIALYRSAGSFKKASNARAWIYTIARNTTISLLRKQKEALPEDTLENIPDGWDIERHAEQKDELDRLLRQLDDISRKIVLLHAVSDLKHHEIARILSLPLGTVYRKYSQSIKKLKKEYSRTFVEEALL